MATIPSPGKACAAQVAVVGFSKKSSEGVVLINKVMNLLNTGIIADKNKR